MKITRKLTIAVLWGTAALLNLGISYSGAEFPDRTITLINPQAPGGAHDAQGRAFAAVAEKYLGKPMVVVNKPGAQTMVGSVYAAQAPADGYTLLLGSTMTTTVVEWDILEGKKPPVTRDDFVTIGSMTLIPTVVSVPMDSPWKTLDDLVQAAKAKPGHYAFSSGGLLSTTHLGTELLARAYGLKFRHVPFKGGGPAITALVGKHVDFTTQFTITSIPMARGGKIRILAAQSDRRVKAIPQVPTLKELGVNAENYMWVGLVAPKKTPPPVVAKLRELAEKVIQDKAFSDIIEKLGGEVHFMNGEQLDKFWTKESAEHAKLLSDLVKAGLKIDK